MTRLRTMPQPHQPTDEELVAALVGGSQEALSELYARYAPLVFGLSVRALDAAAAEDIVQEVFVTVWRQAERFDPTRGPVRAWVVRMAQSRMANELRRRRRRPVTPDPDGALVGSVPDDGPGPVDVAWREYRRASLRSAFAELPPDQQKALGLAFFEDMTHEQVASVLDLPLGTAKTRIRTGIQKLRGRLPQVATASLAALLVVLGVRAHVRRLAFERDERALALVTSSDSTNLRLGAVGSTPAAAHARYRGRAGTPLAVVTLTAFPPAPAGRAYQGWVRHADVWTSLGTIEPDATGVARVIIEGPELAAAPDAIEITLEPAAGSTAPSGPVVVQWPEP
jgi:RNA polymerase sigma-70 factor (ECF subfamily)